MVNPNVFSLAPQGTYGNEGKGELHGPFYEDLDLSFAKVFPITERQHLQARFEMFNAGSTWHHGAWFPCASVAELRQHSTRVRLFPLRILSLFRHPNGRATISGRGIRSS